MIFLVLIISPFLPLHAAEFYVLNPTSFQTALTTAGANGESDLIHVVSGVYSVTTTLSFSSTEPYSLTIQGAGSGATVLDGGGVLMIMSLSSSGTNAVMTISGITFQNGTTTASGAGLNATTGDGGIQIENCAFDDNAVLNGDSVGGGVSINSDAGPLTVVNCQFRRNASSGNVGGLFVGTDTGPISVSGCYFEFNAVNMSGGSEYFGDGGGAMMYSNASATATVTGCTFVNNSAHGGSNPDAGGLMIYLLGSNSTAVVETNTFIGNQAGLDAGGCMIRLNAGGTSLCNNNLFTSNIAQIAVGGGLMIYQELGQLTCSNNTFDGNQAGEDGGGAWMYHGTGINSITGNTFHDNTALAQNGGGLTLFTEAAAGGCSRNIFHLNSAGNVAAGLSYATTSGNMALSNNTYYGNSAVSDGGGCYIYIDQNSAVTTIRNEIFRDGSPNEFAYGSTTGTVVLTVLYSDIEAGGGEPWFGTGCIDDDPLFRDAADGNFRLLGTSPCIDTGDPSSPNDPDGSRADMGAIPYDHISAALPALSPPMLLILLAAFGFFVRKSSKFTRVC